MGITGSLYSGVLTLVKSQDKDVVSVGDTVNYCITVNPQYVTPQADIIWVIDRSGSMNYGINNIIANLDYFTQELSGRHIDYRNGLETFVDGNYDSYGFAETDSKFESWLAGIPCAGGIEQDLEALYVANTFPWRQNASKTMILITDEAIPCSEADGDPLSLSLTATDLYSQGVIIHAITFNPSRYGTGDLYEKCNPIYLPPLAGGIWLDYSTPASGWDVFLQILGQAVATMNNFVLRDPLPPQLAPVTGSLNGGTVVGNEIVWNYSQIDRGTPLQVCFQAVVTQPFTGQLANVAYGSADGITETSSNETDLFQATYTVTQTDTPTYTFTDTPTLTVTLTATPTFSETPTYTPSFTPTYSISATFTETFTYTQTPSLTFTCTPTFTCTETFTGTFTITGTYTATPTITPSASPSFSATVTGTFTYTITSSPTFTYTDSQTSTMSPTYTPSFTDTITCTVTPTPTKDHDHYIITAPATVKAGQPFYITVTAMTSAIYGNEVADNYAGTLHLSTSAAVFTLPDDYAYVPATDAGSHIFQVVLMTPGTQTITGNDTVDTGMTGTASILVTTGDAIGFIINAPSSVTAGQVFYITVTAKDAYGDVATGYTGTVSFSSTDSNWVSPGDTQFTAADNGVKILAVTMKTTGIQRIHCQDITDASINGTSNDINVIAGALAKFLVTAPSSADSGVAFNFVVTAQDAYGNVITNYTGTVHFSSTDGSGILPADYSFQLSDSGSRIFSSTLITNGIQTITATDIISGSISGTSNNINVITPATSYGQPLLLTSYLTAANTYEFVYIYISQPANTAIANNNYLEYDVFVPSSSADFYTGTEFAGSFGDMRDYGQASQTYIIDQNGVRCHPSMDLGAYADGTWYHRKFNISALGGATYNQAELSQDTGNIGYNGAPSNKAGTFNAVFDNIQFKDSSGNVVKNFFSNFNTIPFNNTVMVDGNLAANQGNGGISTPAPINNYIWVVKDYSLAQSPAGNITADGASSCTITAHMYAPDNTAIGYAIFDFTSSRPEDIIAPVAVSLNTKAITDWSGNAFARVSSTKAGQANITVRGAHISKIITVNFIAGPASKVSLSPGTLSMQTGMTSTLYADITDQFGNFVSDTRNITVNSGSGTFQFSTDNGSTWSPSAVFQGTAIKSLLVRDSAPETVTVTASASGVLSGSSVIYVNNSQASYLVIHPVTSTSAAGNPYAIALQAKDSSGNNAFSNSVVQVSSVSSTMKFSVDQTTWSQSLNVTLNNGSANLYYMDTIVGNSKTITAHDSAGALTDGKAYATIVAGQAAILSATSNKYSVPAGQWVTITAQVTDLYGNPIVGQWVTGTAMVQTGKTQNAAIASLSNTTNASGQITIFFKVSTDATGSMDYCVIDSPGLLGTTITISASAAATHLAFLPAPMSQGADKIGTLYINAKDANGYDSPATVSPDYVTLTANSANVLFSLDKINWGTTVIAALDSSGAATVYVKSHYTGTYTLTAHDGHITDGTDTLTVVTGYFIMVSPSSNTTAAAGSFVTITAQVVDQNGNTIGMQGVLIDFSTNNGSISPLETSTDSSGKATALLQLSILSGVQHVVTVKMTNPDDTETSGIITTVPVVSFAVSAPASVYKGQPFTINVRAKDAYGATVDTYNNTVTFFSTDAAASLPADYKFALADAGVVAFTATLNTDGIFTITVKQTTDMSVTGTSPNILVIEPPTPTLTVTPTKTATSTYTYTPTATQTATGTATFTPTLTATGTWTGTETPSATGTSTATGTQTFTGTATFTPTDSPTYTQTQTFTETPTATATQTFTATPTDSPTVTQTITQTITQTFTPTMTFTETEPFTATATPTTTQTETLTASPSMTQTATYSETETSTATLTASPTLTSTIYLTFTFTNTPTVTTTATPTPTITLTQIPLDAYEYDGDYEHAKPIYPWQRQEHNIVPATDVDWLSFTLSASSDVIVETWGDAIDTEMWLYDSSGVAAGTYLAYDDDGGIGACSKIEEVLPAGTYYVKIQSYDNETIIPDYFVTMTIAGPDAYEPDNTYTQAKYIQNGETQIRSIFPMTDVDWIKFDVTTPSYVDIKTSGVSDEDTGDTVMWLYTSAGVPNTYLLYNDDIDGKGLGYDYFSEITGNLTQGTYYIRIQQYSQSEIIPYYNLSLNMTPITPTPTSTAVLPDMYEPDNTYLQAKTILSGVQQEHSINTPTDVDWVKFTVAVNSVVTINTSGVSGDTVIYLYNATGVPNTYLAMNNDDGLGFFSGLTETLGPGTYYVEVMQNGQNAIIPSYYLAVNINPITPTCTQTPVVGDMYENDDTFENAKVIVPGVTQTHSIHVPTDVDWVKFTLTQESMIHIWTSNTLGDTEMYLYNDVGVPTTYLAYDDNSGGGFCSSITMTLPPGIYYAEVNEKGKNQTIDSYNLDLNVLAVTPTSTQTPVPPDIYEPDNVYTSASWIYTGTPQTHSIDNPADTDWVKFTIGSQGTVNITTSGASGATSMWLYSSSGVPVTPIASDIEQSGFAGITRMLGPGTYYAEVQETGQNAVIPQYTITLNVSQFTATITVTYTVTPTSTPQGELDSYEYDGDYLHANYIYNGVPQIHSIYPVGDVDWVKFTLTYPSDIVISSIGPGQSGDTGLYLYTAAGAATGTYLLYDDDSGGMGVWSLISTTLQPGTYYAEVVSVYKYYGMPQTIPEYTLSLSVVILSTPTSTITPAVSATPTFTITKTATQTIIATPTVTLTPTMSLNQALDNYSLTFTTMGNSQWAGEGSVYYYNGGAAQSGAIGSNMQTYLQTTTTGPGMISFYWKVSSQPASGLLDFYIDNTKIQEISGNVDWQQFSYLVPDGVHTLTWEYSKDSSSPAGSDAGWVDEVVFTYMTPTNTPALTSTGTQTITPTATATIDFATAVDCPGTVFSSYGAAAWFGEASTYYYGGSAGQSGHVTASQYSYVETDYAGPGNLSFYWKVSSQLNSDYLELFIDGVLTSSISGEAGWTLQTYTLGAGDHVIRWMYTKDASGDAGSDCGWIDKVSYSQYTMTVTYSNTPTMTITRTSTISPTFTITPIGGSYTATGLWHQVPDSQTPPGRTSPSPDSWYYGLDSTLTYDTGARNTGDLIGPVYYNIAPGSSLTFLSWEQTENSPYYDTRNVYISTDGGTTWAQIYNLFGIENVWHQVTIDLSAYVGQNVRFKFTFDTVDAYANDYRGWYLDDITLAGPTPTITPTGTFTGTSTSTVYVSATNTRTLTSSITPSVTGTMSSTLTWTPTFTPSITSTMSSTPTYTPTCTSTVIILGLWHQVPDSEAPGGDPSTSPLVWYYGIDSTLTYDTGDRTYGSMITQAYYNIQAGSYLTFLSWEETEDSPDYDLRNIYISTDMGASWVKIDNLYGTEDVWYQVAIPLSAYAGQDVMFRFEFDSVDGYANDFRGWYVDDISVIVPTATATNTGTVTSTPPPTETYTATETLTVTETGVCSPTYTPTATQTETESPVLSETPTYTYTPTATETEFDSPTYTATETQTETESPVVSETPTYTETPTSTETEVCSPTGTFTISPTSTESPIVSETPTYTLTVTETEVCSPTYTFTISPTSTESPIVSETPTYTETPTPTETEVCSPTDTFTISPTSTESPIVSETPTYTETPTWTITLTGTPTATDTSTATGTNTSTPTDTYTVTMTETMTKTFIMTRTSSMTPTGTFTITPTYTQTYSSTPTSSFTGTATITETYSYTATISQTMTGTYSYTATMTLTLTPSETQTATGTVPSATQSIVVTVTPTTAATQSSFEVNDQKVYPNPILVQRGGNFMVSYYLTQDVNDAYMMIYTQSYRLVKRIQLSGYDTAGLKIKPEDVSQFNSFASSSCYYYIEASGVNGRKARSKIKCIIIFK